VVLNTPSPYQRCGTFLILAWVAAAAGCAGTRGADQLDRALAPVPDWEGAGYLAPAALPDSVALVPSRPAEGSLAAARDSELNRLALTLRGSQRWRIAADDADLTFPHAGSVFSCALGIAVTPTGTPHLVTLLRRSSLDARAATAAAKDRYHRARPFAVNRQPTCTPAAEERLRTNGSYPSGHASVGWAWALILAEVSPSQADAIFRRGRTFGDSRVICNVHWESDVTEGRLVGAAVVARLHADARFLADVEASRVEVAGARARSTLLAGDCNAEVTALAP